MALKKILLVTLCLLTLTSVAGNVFALPSSNETSKQAVFLSPLEGWMPTWEIDTYVTLLQNAGYHVDVLLNEQVSISFLKTGLAKYDIIILRTDGFIEESGTYYCSGDPVNFKARTTFASEFSIQEVRVGVCVGFSLAFLQNSYPANSQLKHGLVYVLAIGGTELLPAFLAAGSSVCISYNEDYSLRFGRMDAFAQALFKYLSQGNTVKDSWQLLEAYLKQNHGASFPDWPTLRWIGDGDYKI